MPDSPDTLSYRRLKPYRYRSLEPFELRLKLPQELVSPAFIEAPDGGAPWVRLGRRGKLRIRPGYAWRGLGTPGRTSRLSMRAGLVHDALYQLMRAGELDHRHWRPWADQVMRDLLIADGVGSTRAAWSHSWARWFGERDSRRAEQVTHREFAP